MEENNKEVKDTNLYGEDYGNIEKYLKEVSKNINKFLKSSYLEKEKNAEKLYNIISKIEQFSEEDFIPDYMTIVNEYFKNKYEYCSEYRDDYNCDLSLDTNINSIRYTIPITSTKDEIDIEFSKFYDDDIDAFIPYVEIYISPDTDGILSEMFFSGCYVDCTGEEIVSSIDRIEKNLIKICDSGKSCEEIEKEITNYLVRKESFRG